MPLVDILRAESTNFLMQSEKPLIRNVAVGELFYTLHCQAT